MNSPARKSNCKIAEKYFIAMLILLFIFVPFASSTDSWFSGFFKKITGYATDNSETGASTPILQSCPYECCLADSGYEERICASPKICKENKCLDETQTTSPVIPANPVPATPLVKEQVKCIFVNSNTMQKCYSQPVSKNGLALGTFVCYGTGSCSVDVAGLQDTKLTWSSSCGGEYSTLIDGNNEYVEFKCPEQTSTTNQQTPVANQVKEQVKCIFANSNTMQRCGTDDGRFSCEGVGSCVAGISGETGKKLTWKSTCGGYAYTVIDGNDEYAEFKCSETRVVPASVTTESCRDNDGLDYFFKSYSEDSYGRRSVDNCRVIISSTEYYDTLECTGANCYVLESSCSSSGTLQAQVWKCPNSCKDGACIKETKEQVECIFYNSKVLLYPHSSEEKCYTDDNKFGCIWSGEVTEQEINGKKIRYAYCVAETTGETGKKLAWKSTCGGYAYTVIDGNNEKAEFKCIQETNVTQGQILGKGFKRAYWKCYDSAELSSSPVASTSVFCQSSEYWQDQAKNFCANHCNYENGITKCGINSFSVSDECYFEFESIYSAVPETRDVKKIAMPTNSEPGKLVLVYFYSDTCPYCLKMDEELNKAIGELGIGVMRVNILESKELIESYGITAVPSLLLLQYTPNGLKEYLRQGSSDSAAIIEWVNNIKSAPLPAETEKFTGIGTETQNQAQEEILICKDSCPLEAHCYAFGYRKQERFCSDTGAFKEELKENEFCENNFECQSNVCVDRKCLSSGLIQAVISWLKRFFGSG